MAFMGSMPQRFTKCYSCSLKFALSMAPQVDVSASLSLRPSATDGKLVSSVVACASYLATFASISLNKASISTRMTCNCH